jgi:hypothetical protein
MYKNYVLIFATGLAVGLFFNLGNSTKYINKTSSNTHQENNLQTQSKNNNSQVNNYPEKDTNIDSKYIEHYSLNDLKSAFQDIAKDLIIDQKRIIETTALHSIQSQNNQLSEQQIEQQNQKNEIASSYMTNAISRGLWSESDSNSFRTLSRTISSKKLLELLRQYSAAVNKGLLIPDSNSLLY